MRLLHPALPWVGEDEIVDNEVVVAVSRDELAVLAGAVNEALEAVEEWEFDTRLGVPPQDARALREQLGELLRNAHRAQ